MRSTARRILRCVIPVGIAVCLFLVFVGFLVVGDLIDRRIPPGLTD